MEILFKLMGGSFDLFIDNCWIIQCSDNQNAYISYDNDEILNLG